ncbi:MAG: HTTM domain-containing protein [Bacteroidota bacterium]
MHPTLKKYFEQYTDAATLAFFRLAFGILMVCSVIRFAANGWIDKFYIQPQFHFTYYGFSWVKPYGYFTYIAFIICGLSALMVAIGYKYRLAMILFFLSFTYTELLDKTTYLNHYYFVSLVSFVMIFLPANAAFSIDAYKNPAKAFDKIPRYTVDIIKLLLAIVYFYAGLAKLNSDWLIDAMPLKIWLPANANLPVIGPLLVKTWVTYAFSYIGAVYDLFIVFLLINRRTRLLGFVLVVVFHLLTRILFPIGVFPYVMIVSSLLFFSPAFHRKTLNYITSFFRIPENQRVSQKHISNNKPVFIFLMLFMVFQLAFPFRYLLYPQELFWTEEGFRFSWRVMLMEKAGNTEFVVSDPKSGKTVYVDNKKFLTAFQEKQMSFQPDFILEYAHYLHDYYEKQGMFDPIVKVNSHVALNGRLVKQYIDPNVNLAKEYESFNRKTWIQPFNDTITGF